MFKFLILVCTLCESFKLNEFYNNDNKLIEIYPCDTISVNLWETANDVVDMINDLGIYKLVLYKDPMADGRGNTICDTNDRSSIRFTAMTYPDTMDILINKELQVTTNSLHNVILHEIVHALGLTHVDTPGMMSYNVRRFHKLNGDHYFIEDERKLWLSIDDISGISKSYRETKKRYCDKITFDPDEFLKCLNTSWIV